MKKLVCDYRGNYETLGLISEHTHTGHVSTQDSAADYNCWEESITYFLLIRHRLHRT
jgi:hypothetical protein